MSEQVKNLRKKTNENNEYIPDIFNTQIKASKDIEDGIISALLIDITSLDEVSNILKPEMFYYNVNKIIFEVILYLENKKIGIDLITVAEELKNRNKIIEVGGVFYLTQLANKIGSTAHIVSYARLLYENFLERRVAQVGVEIYKKAISQELDVFDLIDYTGKKISEVADSIQGSNQSKMSDAIYEELKLIDTRMFKAQNGSVLGVPTGFKNLDYITGGWQKSDLIIVAGRPSMGKTAATLNLARNASVLGNIGVGVFSLEMSTSQLTARLMSSEAEIENDKLRNGRMNQNDYARLTSSIDLLKNANIVIDDTPALSIIELKARARRMKVENNIGLIVIDYLQLMSGSGKKAEGSREQEISSISRGLKALAKELDIPVIALSQLSRAVESRAGDKRPILSDLRESGSIEQDADIVILLYRPEYYGLPLTDGSDSKGVADFIIAKHRNGSLSDIRVEYVSEYTKFKDYVSTKYQYKEEDNSQKVESDNYAPIKKDNNKLKGLTPLNIILQEDNNQDDIPF
jgi:replicative DNA helicase